MNRQDRAVIRELVAYLPQLDAEPCCLPSENWWPDYAPHVSRFFNTVYERFLDKDYAQQGIPRLEALLADDAAVDKADVATCKRLLTLVNRGEKFCDGYRRAAIEEGRVQAVLRRLAELEREG